MASISKRILNDGSVRWLAQIRKKGYKTVNITKLTKTAVANEARKVELAMDNGTWDEFATSEQKAGQTKLEHFIDLYLKDITPFKKGGKHTLQNETAVLQQVLRSPIAKMDIYNIKRGHIIELRNTWRDNNGNKPTTINRKLTTLHDVFKHIQTTWKHESINNPVQGSKLPVPTGTGVRSRSLSKYELATLRQALDQCQSPYMRWMFDLALETAARRRELLENLWDNVNLDAQWLKVPEHLSKTRKERFIPLTPEAKRVLSDIKAHQGGEANEIFPITTKAFEEAWKKTIKRTEIIDFQFRDTRHMASTMLSNIYPKMQDLAKITGHDKLDTLLIYYEENIADQVKHMQAYYK